MMTWGVRLTELSNTRPPAWRKEKLSQCQPGRVRRRRSDCIGWVWVNITVQRVRALVPVQGDGQRDIDQHSALELRSMKLPTQVLHDRTKVYYIAEVVLSYTKGFRTRISNVVIIAKRSSVA
jgi:hypothetical protein